MIRRLRVSQLCALCGVTAKYVLAFTIFAFLFFWNFKVGLLRQVLWGCPEGVLHTSIGDSIRITWRCYPDMVVLDTVFAVLITVISLAGAAVVVWIYLGEVDKYRFLKMNTLK